MKGTFFQRPLEFRIHINGETWPQGSEIDGTLSVKNHASEPSPLLSDVHVDLALGTLRKVRAKTPGAFDLLETAKLPEQVIAPGAEVSMPWKFKTELNSPISDKSGSLFIVYGRGPASEQIGQLQLPIVAHPVIQEFLSRFQLQFRFVRKAEKDGKHGVEIKLAPPSAPTFASLEFVTVSFRFEGEDLQIRYVFNAKGVEATSAAFDVKKVKKEHLQTIPAKEQRTMTGRWNHDRMEAAIREALDLVESKLQF